jgi:glycosyltransferase involved in cell wall biosynthesis
VFLDIFLLLKALRLTKTNHYDCIHGVEEGAAIALVCKAIFGIPIIYDMHSSIPEQIKKITFFNKFFCKKIALWFEKFLIVHADAIITSVGLAILVKSIVPSKSVWECFFFGDIPHGRKEALSRRLEIFDRPTILYTGNFSFYQGLDLLIEAAAIMRSVVPDVVFLLVGGTESDIKPIDRLVKMNNLEKTVRLINRVQRSEVPNYLSLADVLILPRRKGLNAPLKVFEYMRSQKPIVATDIPAHRAILSDKTAFLVKPEAKTIANGLICVIKDKKMSKKLASEAFTAVQSLKENSLRKTLIAAYGSIIKTEHKPG